MVFTEYDLEFVIARPLGLPIQKQKFCRQFPLGQRVQSVAVRIRSAMQSRAKLGFGFPQLVRKAAKPSSGLGLPKPLSGELSNDLSVVISPSSHAANLSV